MKNLIIVYHYIAHYRVPIFKELAKSNEFDLKIVTGFETDARIKIALENDLHNNKINFHKVKNIWLFRNLFLYQKGLLKYILKRDNKTFIFLGNPYFLSTWTAIILCKFSGKRVLIWTHGITKEINGLKLLVYKTLWMLSDDILLYGNYAKKQMISKGIDPKKMHVIYNSLDYNKQVEVRNKLDKSDVYRNHFNNDFPVVIFSGRLNKVKRLELILESQKVLHDRNVFFNVIFVGDGPEIVKLKEIVNDYNLDNFNWFFGSCYEESKMGELYFNADVCLAPGNVGLTAMHSMVYGTPVITHSDYSQQMPEFESVEKGVTGDFFEKDNIDDLVLVLHKWLNKTHTEKVEISNYCINVIDEKYNPIVQKKLITKVLNNEVV
jgi:glycosyltransferase involved in cell wall biosynthesis